MSETADGLPITSGVVIPADELRFRASRAGGPGGQHVNTADTRVELRWSVRDSRALDPAQKERVTLRLGKRVNRDGELVLTCAVERSQHRNRTLVTERFVALLKTALARRRRRVPTAPGPAAHERRLQTKRVRANRKRGRGRTGDEDD